MSETNYQAILQTQYNVNATSVTPFKSNVALVKLASGQPAIFKRARTEKGASPIDKFRFRNEIRMYKVLQQETFNHLNVPELYASGKDHILIEYVEREEGSYVTEADFAKAYYEMQNIQVPSAIFFDLFNQVTRGVWYKGIVVPILSLRKQVGLKKAIQVPALFLKLHLQTKRLKKRYWLHGDLAVRNIYYQLNSNKTFFIDFENLYYTRKWPLLEIFQRCVWYEGDEKKSFRIDLNTLNQYLLQAKENKNREILECFLQNQFRLSLLISTISRIIRPKTKTKSLAFNVFLNVLLKDASASSLFHLHIEPLLKNPDMSAKSITIEELKSFIKD